MRLTAWELAMRCPQCGHRPNQYDPDTTNELPVNLDVSDRGQSWTTSDGCRWTWDGEKFVYDHRCYEADVKAGS